MCPLTVDYSWGYTMPCKKHYSYTWTKGYGLSLIHISELMNIFREVADVQTADMLDLDVPALCGGKPIIVESEPDWYVKQVMEDFVVRAERIRGGGVEPSVDNFLKITHEADVYKRQVQCR